MGKVWEGRPHLDCFGVGLQDEDADALLVAVLVHEDEGVGQA